MEQLNHSSQENEVIQEYHYSRPRIISAMILCLVFICGAIVAGTVVTLRIVEAMTK
jgi:hypothetical protein